MILLLINFGPRRVSAGPRVVVVSRLVQVHSVHVNEPSELSQPHIQLLIRNLEGSHEHQIQP